MRLICANRQGWGLINNYDCEINLLSDLFLLTNVLNYSSAKHLSCWIFPVQRTGKFPSPNKDDILATQQILLLFGNASGLRTNIDKCVAYSMACEDTNLNHILQGFWGNTRNSAMPLSRASTWFQKAKKS
jgi:hypothetical protein